VEQSFTIGRSGLKVPLVEWRDGYGTNNIATFLQELWVANSNVSLRDVYGRFDRERLGSKELVLPANDKDPLMVLRASYEPYRITPKGLGITALSNSGVEKYQILKAPETIDSFQEAYAIEYRDRAPHDDYLNVISGGWKLSKGGKAFYLPILRYADLIDGFSDMNPGEQNQAIDQRYQDQVHEVFDEIVTLLV
jgi:hypothetical protein